MIDTDELQRELDATQGAFRKWAAATGRTAQDCKGSYLRNIRAASGEVESLNDRYHKLERQAAEVQQCMARDAAERDTLRGVADSLVGERDALARRLQQLRADLDGDTTEARGAEQDLQQERAAVASRLGALDKVLSLYRNALGLELVPGDDELALVFTLVDPRAPAREFRFAVRVLEDNTYEVTSCEPPLPELPELSALLRQESRFAEFVRGARRAFAALVGREIEAAE